MGILGKFFKSDVNVLSKNSEINNALKILQNGSLPYNDRASALSKLKSIFLASNDKDDLRTIAQSILRTVTTDESAKVREIAFNTFDNIVGTGSQNKLSAVAEYAVPILMEIAEYKSEDAKELRIRAFGVLSKIASFAINDERLGFLAHSLSDKTDSVRVAVVCTFENLVKVSDDGLKRRIARFSLPALCEALNDPAIWVRAARALGGLGKYALRAAPFLYERLDDKDGEWAGSALRNITGEQYGNKEKEKWEKWLQKSVVK
jgi:hypothetical protein